MKIKRNILYAVMTGIFTLALVAGNMVWGAPVYAQSVSGNLTAAEIDGLQFMLEEEKLARDVYLTLEEQWNLRVFTNISRAEQQHMNAVAALLDRYGIADPTAGNESGVFTDPELQALYNQLVATGSLSVADALRVGAAVEEIDILDLRERAEQTRREDILRVYTRLEQGSANHLRAFVSNLTRQTDEEYSPQYLDQDAYDDILDDDGNRGNGRGRRGNGGQGRAWGRR